MPDTETKQGVLKSWVQNGLTVSAAFVLLRFLLTPIRIRVLTELLEPSDYGMVTFLTMTAHAVALLLSLGGFEFWLRSLPAAQKPMRLSSLWQVFRVSSFLGLAVSGAVWCGWGPDAWYGDEKVQLSGAVVAVLFILVLHIQQRLYYLLGTQSHLRARITQLLWSDLWYLFLIPFGAGMIWSAEKVLWIWGLWMLGLSLVTFTWVPLRKARQAFKSNIAPAPWVRMSIPILPILFSEWIFRLSGQYVLLEARGAEVMALYGLALNLSLVGYTAGVPLVDVCMTQFNSRLGLPEDLEPNPERVLILSKALRLVIGVCLPVGLALFFLSDALLSLLAAPAFFGAAAYLPWAAPVPFLMLCSLLFGRLAMSFSKTELACVAGLGGGGLTLVLSLLWVAPFGVPGVFFAVQAGLFLCTLVLFIGLKGYRWIKLKPLGLISLGAGALLLGVSFAGIQLAQLPSVITLGCAGVLSLIIAFLFRWVGPAEFALFRAQPSPSEVSIE